MKKLLLVELGPVAYLSLVTTFVVADYVHQLQVRPEFKSVRTWFMLSPHIGTILYCYLILLFIVN